MIYIIEKFYVGSQNNNQLIYKLNYKKTIFNSTWLNQAFKDWGA